MAKEMLSLAVDAYNRYPSETLCYSVRLMPGQTPQGASVVVKLPNVLTIESFSLTDPDGKQQVYSSEQGRFTYLTWDWAPDLQNVQGELQILTRILPSATQGPLACEAILQDEAGNPLFQIERQVMVNRQADLLQYLPEIYNRDDLTNRFLILLESFWTPIAKQINSVDSYFDPRLTTPEMVSWLGSWFGLSMDEDLSEENQRKVVASIAPIFAQKGTRQALMTFLRMYTGGTVEVVEHRDTNLVLGKSTYLGYQIALGTQNHPFSFDVMMQVPAPAPRPGESVAERRQKYRKRIESIIEQYKPAQTVFNLTIDYIESPVE